MKKNGGNSDLNIDPQYDGFGGQGCERVTPLSLRTAPQKLVAATVIVAGAVAIFGTLVSILGIDVSAEKFLRKKITQDLWSKFHMKPTCGQICI
jgi:hypothetical protein